MLCCCAVYLCVLTCEKRITSFSLACFPQRFIHSSWPRWGSLTFLWARRRLRDWCWRSCCTHSANSCWISTCSSTMTSSCWQTKWSQRRWETVIHYFSGGLSYLFAMGKCWNRPSVLGCAGIWHLRGFKSINHFFYNTFKKALNHSQRRLQVLCTIKEILTPLDEI